MIETTTLQDHAFAIVKSCTYSNMSSQDTIAKLERECAVSRNRAVELHYNFARRCLILKELFPREQIIAQSG